MLSEEASPPLVVLGGELDQLGGQGWQRRVRAPDRSKPSSQPEVQDPYLDQGAGRQVDIDGEVAEHGWSPPREGRLDHRVVRRELGQRSGQAPSSSPSARSRV